MAGLLAAGLLAAGFPAAGYLQPAVQPAFDEGWDKPVQAAAQGGFTRAGLTDNDGKLAGTMTVVDLVEGRFRGVPVGEREVV